MRKTLVLQIFDTNVDTVKKTFVRYCEEKVVLTIFDTVWYCEETYFREFMFVGLFLLIQWRKFSSRIKFITLSSTLVIVLVKEVL